MLNPLLLRRLVVLPAVLLVASTRVLAAEAAHPDFTGIWTIYLAPGESPFGNFGRPPPPQPFTAEGQRRSDEYRKLLGPENANPGAYCVDYGMPTMMEQAGAYPVEFIQKPDQLTIIYEVEGETRRIYLGRRLPPEKRLPSRQGYSEGHWDGDVLVVETSDLSDGVDQIQHPRSDQAKIVERFSLGKDAKGTKVISYEMLMTDPVFYTEPIKVQRKWAPLENGFIIPYRCPDEFWLALLQARRAQLKAGKPVDARMSDVYKAREVKE